MVDGVEQHFPDASYYIYYQEQSGKRIWKKIGRDPQEEVRAADFQESYMRGVHAGVPVKTDDIPIMVGHTLEPYLEEYKLSHRVESYKLMKQTLYEFYVFCRKNIVNRITWSDSILGSACCCRNCGQRLEPDTTGHKALEPSPGAAQFRRHGSGTAAGFYPRGIVRLQTQENRKARRFPCGLSALPVTGSARCAYTTSVY
ncbi:MAG: hypothetical protein WA830_04010 [Candidatus Sulfotelmatobacter sp.]